MMKKIYRSLLYASVILLLFATSPAFAQQVVTGKITDVKNQVMPGVNVIKKGTTAGTSTDSNGNFSLEANSEDVLVVSFIGYKSQETKVGSQTKFRFTLEEDVSTLNEVVVVGYGEVRKSDLTGAIASVKGEELTKTVTSGVDQALIGRVAGVSAV